MRGDAGDKPADDAVQRSARETNAHASEPFVKIAEMYDKGEEIPRDTAETLKWYRKAADTGDVEASVKLASLLVFKQIGTAQDYAEAYQRCDNAAKRKFAPAAFCVGFLYQHGFGVAKDSAKAVNWFNKAAELGQAQAMLELGKAYWKGDGVKPDLVNAYTWISLAEAANLPEAQQQSELLKKEMNEKQIAKAKEKTEDWEKQHPLLIMHLLIKR
jgi:uncharacterized protein